MGISDYLRSAAREHLGDGFVDKADGLANQAKRLHDEHQDRKAAKTQSLDRIVLSGPSHHQAEITGVRKRSGARGDEQLSLVLDLRAESKNPHDKRAIRVEAHGRLVGYIPRDKTATVHKRLKRGKGRAAGHIWQGRDGLWLVTIDAID